MTNSFDDSSAGEKNGDMKNAFFIAITLCLILASFFFAGCLSRSKPSSINIQNCVNPNACSMDELMLLDGIGQAKAKAIIDYRQILIHKDPRTKPFNKPQDLANVEGIGEKTVENIKQHLCFD